jgi:hypothetical protein
MKSRYLTPPAIAARYKVSVDKVHAWIRSGQLRASNLATKATGRPRYSVDERDLEAFITSRSVAPPMSIKGGSRRRQKSNTVEFF